jgi:hypothetical protein
MGKAGRLVEAELARRFGVSPSGAFWD